MGGVITRVAKPPRGDRQLSAERQGDVDILSGRGERIHIKFLQGSPALQDGVEVSQVDV